MAETVQHALDVTQLRSQFLLLLLACGLAAAEPVDRGPEIHLWPLVQNETLPEGKHRTLLLFLYHRTTNADGSPYSRNILNYVEAPDFRAILPLWFQLGPEDHRHSMLVPLWFHGPSYTVVPPLLSGSWRREDGGSSTWITPLVHLGRHPDGSLDQVIAGPYVQGKDYQVLFPLAYRFGSGDQAYSGVIPAWFSGPNWWCFPPALTGSWRNDHGGRTTWVTPLVHVGSDSAGVVRDWHVLNWWHGRDNDVIFPLAWWGGNTTGVLPVWFSGPNWWCVPPAITGAWDRPGGGRTLLVTPLYHHSTDASGEIDSLHVLNFWHDRNLDLLFPIAWRSGQPGNRSGAIVPLWFQGPTWWIAPPALSGGFDLPGGGRSDWITPLWHRTRDAAGNYDLHAGLWFSGRGPDRGYQTLFPLWYRRWDAQGVHSGLTPLWFSGPDYTIVPPALLARWTSGDGSTHTWVTPLAHRTTRADGSLASQHLLTWFQGSEVRATGSTDWRVLAPFWYRIARQEGENTQVWSGLVPLWLSTPESTIVPLLMSTSTTRADGSSSLWITPLFHRDRDAAGTTTAMHLLTWFSGPDRTLILPFYYSLGPPEARRSGLIPLWFADPDGWTAPLALSRHKRSPDGGTSTWVTPLYHRDTDAAGATTSMHVLTWLRGRDWQAVIPFGWRAEVAGGTNTGILPLWFSSPHWWTIPLALSGGWDQDNGRRTTWITPLFHLEHDATGSVDAWHALNWIHGPDRDLVLPLAWRCGPEGARHAGVLPFWFGGPGYDVVPPLLSARWQRPDGGNTTWVTPLFHVGSNHEGQVTDWHALNWIHDRDDDYVLPFAWFTGPPNARYRTILPLWFQGPNHLVVLPWYRVRHADGNVSSGLVPLWFAGTGWWFSPPALTGTWTAADGSHTVMATPLYHRTTDAQGKLLHQHVLNWVSSEGFDTVLPLYWSWRGDDGARRNLLAPLWYRSSNPDGTGTTSILPPIFAYRSTRHLDTSLPFQLIPFAMQSADDGHEINVLWRLFHRRRLGDSTEYMVGPLWWSEHRPDAPAQWQILGGLVGRDTDLRSRTSRAYVLWGVQIGGRSPFPEVP